MICLHLCRQIIRMQKVTFGVTGERNIKAKQGHQQTGGCVLRKARRCAAAGASFLITDSELFAK